MVRFCWENCNGIKFVKKYSLEQIQVPGEHPCVVFMRKEKGKDRKFSEGWIVVPKEQVFNAINEWHQGHLNMGQERT